jgi:cadmium resistance protein CadD (predicted permease)
MLRPSGKIRTKYLEFQDNPTAVGTVIVTDKRSKVKRRNIWADTRSMYPGHYFGFLLLIAALLIVGVVFRLLAFQDISGNLLVLRRITDLFPSQVIRNRHANDGSIRLSQKYAQFVPKIRKHQV